MLDRIFDDSQPRTPLALAPHVVLNGVYEVGRLLGKGGFGLTYCALDRHLQMPVAIKEYLPAQVAGRGTDQATVQPHGGKEADLFEHGLDAFLAEGRTLAKFNHPNIVRVLAFFRENGTGYLVMPFLEGKSLDGHLDAHDGKLPHADALDLMRPILDGLAAVHEAGFLHRDIKPQNVYLTDDGQIILLDFGAARIAFGQESQSLSSVLTPGYAPFEQYFRKGRQGPWTDVYAAAATLYKMVTGIKPPEAPERNEEDSLRPAHELAPDVPPALSEALRMGLAPTPEDRPQSVRAFQDLLDRALSGEPLVLPDRASEGAPETVAMPGDAPETVEAEAPPAAPETVEAEAPPSVAPETIAAPLPPSPKPSVEAGPTPSGETALVLNAERACKVFVDGQEVGRLAMGETRTVPLTPGTHAVRAEGMSGEPPRETTVTLAPGEQRPLTIRLGGDASGRVSRTPTRGAAGSAAGPRRSMVPWIIGGGTLLLLLILAVVVLPRGGGSGGLSGLNVVIPAQLAVGEAGRFSASVASRDPATFEWQWGDGGSSVGAAPTHVYRAPGTYTVRLTARSGSRSETDTGTVTVVERAINQDLGGPPPPPPPGGTTATIAIPYFDEGFLGAGDPTLDSGEFRDYYSFFGRAGQYVAISVSSDEFDTYLIVQMPTGEQLDNDDYDGSTTDSVIEGVLPADGIYEVLVTTFAPGEAGSYFLEISTDEGNG